MKKVLFVDDDPDILAGLRRHLRKKFAVETAIGPERGWEVIRDSEDIAIVIADMQMPGMNGVDFLQKVREFDPDIVRLMLTGNTDLETAMKAVNEGSVFRFLVKPTPPEVLEAAILAAMAQYDLIHAERVLLETTVRGSVRVLTEVLDLAAPEAFGRCEKLRHRMIALAGAMRVRTTWELEVAAMLSPLGCIMIPARLLRRHRAGGELTSTEIAMLKRIPEVGAGLIRNIPRLEGAARIVFYQQKHFDGGGTPQDSVCGDRIPFGSRILKILLDLEEFEWRGVTTAQALETMSCRDGVYDSAILKSAIELFSYNSAHPAAPCHSGLVPLAELREGHRLLHDLETRDGQSIAKAGSTITPALFQLIRNFASAGALEEAVEVEA